jgi:uncharacterized membrane protein HdeD (DUF308 family)
MYVNPGAAPDFGRQLTHDAAEQVARNWWRMLLSGLLLIVAGVLIFSIDWTVRSLATFLGVVFIVEGINYALTSGFDARVKRTNVITGLLSIAAGIMIIVWPSPGLTALGIILGAWLIVLGTLAIAGAFAVRAYVKDWWLFLLEGLVMIPLGVLALARPGATLAALVTVGGIFAVAVGVMRVVLAFEIKRLPKDVDELWSQPTANGTPAANPTVPPVAPTAS